jgi:MarR family transcriptional regulator, organic hydroperoxide resistance regulator
VEATVTDVSGRSGLPPTRLPVGDAIDFLRLVWAVDHALQRRSKAMAATLGITGPQRLVIRIIGRFPSIHARQLAEILHLHPSSLTALLKRLERRDLVRRWPDERDRRRWLLGLTRQGQALNRATPGTIEAAVQRMLDTTTRNDLDVTRAVLGKLARALDGGGRSRVIRMRP